MAQDAEKLGKSMTEGAYHFRVSEIHEWFVKRTFPNLLNSTEIVKKPKKRAEGITENDYRYRHSQRMWGME